VWLDLITKERDALQQRRENQEAELERILDSKALEQFSTSLDSKSKPMISKNLKMKLE